MNNNHNLFLISFLMIVFIIGCNQKENQQQTEMNEQTEISNMKLTSSAFANHDSIPQEFTCDGANINPPLSISSVPENTKSLALIVEDPDAVVGTFIHWVVWNIPPETREIAKGNEPDGAKGKGSSGKLGYIGPCPPSGTHRYYFGLYALDAKLDLPVGSTKTDLENVMQGHILEQTHLMGTYKRNK